MAFKLEALPYAYDALEPFIDKETMEFHHDKHHQSYTNNLNKAIEGTEFDNMEIEEILKKLDKAPADKKNAIKNNAGGYYNHNLFWECMKPGGAKEPQGELLEAINKEFGSFDEFKEKFQKAGAGQFGSGWAWLICKDGKLEVTNSPNQDCPVSDGAVVLLGNDVWEHAYYLKYQNRRADYLKEWWKVVNWDVVAERYECCK